MSISALNMNISKNAQTSVPVAYYKDDAKEKREYLKEDELLINNWHNKSRIMLNNICNTLSIYPVNGFSGDKNTTFYELLTMGSFPYIAGGLTFITIFNAFTKHLFRDQASFAKNAGLKMGLGVIFYGIAKELSKKLVSVPVQLATGIDMNLPFRKVVHKIHTSVPQSEAYEKKEKQLKEKGEIDPKAIEYHKIFESVDFPRMDLLYKDKPGEVRNLYFDEIAKKNGFGTDLNDSDQEVKPFIKGVITKAKTTQNIAQYLWAAAGVGLAMQSEWENLSNLSSFKYSGLSVREVITGNISKIWKIFRNACIQFYNGGKPDCINKNAKIVGRTVLWLAVLTTAIGTINAIRNPYMKNNEKMLNSKIFNNKNKVKED